MTNISKKMYFYVGTGAIILCFIICVVSYFLNYNYLVIYSPYVPYELGFEEANISKQYLLSPVMRTWDTTLLESELIDNTDKYSYDGNTGIVNTKGKGYLELGKYLVTASEQEQRSDIYVSVIDTMEPIFKNLYYNIYLEADVVTGDGILEYFDIEDYDEYADFGIYLNDADLSKAGIYDGIEIVAWDTSGNLRRDSVRLNILTAKDVIKNPKILSINRQGIREVTAKTLRKIDSLDMHETKFGDVHADGMIFRTREEMEKKIEEVKKRKEQVLKEEEDFKNNLLKDKYPDVKDDFDKKKNEVVKKYQEREEELANKPEDNGSTSVKDKEDEDSKKNKDKSDKEDDDFKDKKDEEDKEDKGTTTNTNNSNNTSSNSNSNPSTNNNTTDTGSKTKEPTVAELMAKDGFYPDLDTALEKSTSKASATTNWGDGGAFPFSWDIMVGDDGVTYYKVKKYANYFANDTRLSESAIAYFDSIFSRIIAEKSISLNCPVDINGSCNLSDAKVPDIVTEYMRGKGYTIDITDDNSKLTQEAEDGGSYYTCGAYTYSYQFTILGEIH